MSYEGLCMNCMKKIGDSKVCPYCNHSNDTPQLSPYLPHRTIVGDRYVIGNVIEDAGDSVTYIAFDIERKEVVEVREFLPDSITKRSENGTKLLVKHSEADFYMECLDEFLELYRKLARMRGLSALIVILDIFEENNTAYAVIEHMEGAVSLRDYLLLSEGGYISWEEARVLFMPVLSTLSTLHSEGIIHRGISPTTFYVCSDHKMRIKGFSISEGRNTNTGITPEIFAGYAPVEQFGVDVPEGPWTDIYAFAAVLYRALIGTTPIDSMERMQNDRMMVPAKFAEQIPAYVINALINALQIMPEDRTKTVEQFREELSASPVATIAAEYEAEVAEAPKLRTVKTTEQPKRKAAKRSSKNAAEDKQKAIKAGLIVGGAILLIFIILCLTVLRGHFGSGNKSTGENDPGTISSNTTLFVPEFRGMSRASIETNKSYELDYNIVFVEAESDTVKANYVIEQSIEPGTEVIKGAAITLTVSSGKKMIVLFDVSGDTYEIAEQKLKDAGFATINKATRENDGRHVTGTVCDTPQTIGKEYSYDTPITLTVWVDSDETTTLAY